eukprot:CAMPEP_0116847316 /NCGR_PEP_ID=MMETSP0418-20121206/14367_1 /TAXON_ID=1158023 /ORGANISM="Astrosyne radiata, Strain 13vi08-1A" /LENGTH=84 /DNA_ID=CAMNT_0004478749 /DNA_START=51 /DNA_END=305 /DNA_ORIENTATION=+
MNSGTHQATNEHALAAKKLRRIKRRLFLEHVGASPDESPTHKTPVQGSKSFFRTTPKEISISKNSRIAMLPSLSSSSLDQMQSH